MADIAELRQRIERARGMIDVSMCDGCNGRCSIRPREVLAELDAALAAIPAPPMVTEGCIDPMAIQRLRRWREVGDGPASYTAGSKQFADDVIVLLTLLDDSRNKVAERLRNLAAGPIEPHLAELLREIADEAASDRKELANELERLYNLNHAMLRGGPWDQVLHDHYVQFLQKHASEFIAALAATPAPPMVTEEEIARVLCCSHQCDKARPDPRYVTTLPCGAQSYMPEAKRVHALVYGTLALLDDERGSAGK